ncbi:hypothetical protein GPL21_06950 [Bradyrhizobium pachyrhizi]|uniref:Uncharacterized protein n=1 Tax=Bradyrhizobium pachyrhizi TaxID=280333 RepID=A0A844SC65_9BRAD|nr:hypothetical protein [Bradyrhizobium pachyrhizi]MVT64843.1 hypothetical protein [Bradyrhizobium pachyrhizi]
MTASRDWRQELIEAYPDLFWPPASGPAGSQGYPECDEGWQDLLDTACRRIRTAMSKRDRFHFVQIKEKYGTLRAYWAGRLSKAAKIAIEQAIDLAEARSACTCELCGDEGRLYRAGGILMTRCAAHAQGRPIKVRPGFENIRSVQRIVKSRFQPLVCHRYDRETDSFIEIDPDSLEPKDQ